MEFDWQSLDWVSWFSIEPYGWQAIATAIACGSVIGLERQLRGKPVGIRTSSLIVLGTYIFLATSFEFNGGSAVDPSRVIGQVITGIGFLGAGVMMSKDGAVVGVTSAAAIWMLASIGVMISMGHLLSAFKMSLLVVGILTGVDILEQHTKALTRGVHAKVRTLTGKDRER